MCVCACVCVCLCVCVCIGGCDLPELCWFTLVCYRTSAPPSRHSQGLAATTSISCRRAPRRGDIALSADAADAWARLIWAITSASSITGPSTVFLPLRMQNTRMPSRASVVDFAGNA